MDISFESAQHNLRSAWAVLKRQAQDTPLRTGLAWMMFVLHIVFDLVSLPLWLPYYHWHVEHYTLPYSTGASLALAGIGVISPLALSVLGLLIIFAQPKNRVGWVLLVAMMLQSLVKLCEKYAVYAYVIAPQSELPLSEVALWIQHWVWLIFMTLMLIALPLLFPDGQLPSKRWRWFVRWVLAVLGIVIFIMGFHPDVQIENAFLDIENDLQNPYGISLLPTNLLHLLIPAWFLLLLNLPVACFSLVLRYRNADSATRQQIKWFVYWLSIAILVFFARDLLPAFPDNSWQERVLGTAFFVVSNGLPIVLAITIFKFRLYDIDIIINRTLVYGSITIIIAVVYVLIVGGFSVFFQTQDDILPSLLATGLVALSFQRLRETIQGYVNRLLFGQRDEPYAVLIQLGDRLKSTVMPREILSETTQTIRASLKLPYVHIIIRRSDEIITQVKDGKSVAETSDLPLIYQHERVGDLIVGQRSPDEHLSRADTQVLKGIAHQLAAVAYAIRLQIELQAARERLVTQLETERRRIRRDLHDGLGPALASQTLKLDAALYFLPSELQRARQLIEEVREQSDSLIKEIRRQVHNLRPSAIDEMGLVGAIRSIISRFQVSNQQTKFARNFCCSRSCCVSYCH